MCNVHVYNTCTCIYVCVFLDVTVSLFGSSASGFALASSNVNLNVCTSGASENQVFALSCRCMAPPVTKY